MNIWFNHWFSTAYHIMNYIRSADENIRIIGTNSNPDCVYRLVCDEWYGEPSGDDYVRNCLDFCKEHKIDVFVPHHNMKEICANSTLFAEIGTKILGNTDKNDIEIIYDKIKTYDYLESCGLAETVPEYYSCGSMADFEESAEKLRKNGCKVCFKLAVDEGGTSYHVIDENQGNSIRSGSAGHVTYEKAMQIIKSYNFSVPLLVMPYLSQPEISVDCLKTATGLLMIPRYKLGGRVSEVRFNEQIMNITESISDKFALEMPYNVQYRFCDGKPYLLEINPRMSGGVQLSCTASGINLPSLALKKLLNKPCEWSYPEFQSCKVAHIETPVIIK